MLACAEPFVWTPERQRQELRLDALEALRRGGDVELLVDLVNQDSEFGTHHALADQLAPRLLPWSACRSTYLHAYFLVCLQSLVPRDEDARELEDIFVLALAPHFEPREEYPEH